MIRLSRRPEAPPVLDPLRPHTYGHATVYQALVEDFHGKCYLCESPRRAAQVDHFRPQTDFPELATVWGNLFLACGGSCNQRRIPWPADTEGKRWPKGGMLDPCVDDVEARLDQSFNYVPGEDVAVVEFSPTDPTDLAAENTALELNRIHDEHPKGRELRVEITDTLNRVFRALADLVPPEQPMARQKLRALAQRRAPHAGIVRQMLRRRLAARPDLLEELGLR